MERKCVSKGNDMKVELKGFFTGIWDKVKSIDVSGIKDKISLPESWTNKDMWAMYVRRLIYIVCFAWLMYLDSVIGNAHGWTQASLKNYTGVVFAIICLTSYKLKDFIKIPYLVWTVLFFIAKHFAIEWAWENQYLVANVYPVSRFESNLWNVGIYGIVFIRMFYLYVIEKVKPRMNWPFFGVWLAMMLGMVFSVNDGTWFYWFFLIFGVFYLTNFTQKQLNNLFSGMVEGIIIGFIMSQWQACLYRPYDELRYEGWYANCNINALFYVVSYLAVLGKWYLMKLKRRPFIMTVPCVLLGGSLWALTIFTMCRTALISMSIFTVLFIGFQMISRRKWKIWELVKNTVLILVAIIIMFEPTYNLVRYVPAYTNSPVYFVMEEIEPKIQMDEAFDSEKYVEYEEMLEGAFRRIPLLEDIFTGIRGKVVNAILPVLKVHAAEGVDENYEMMVPMEWRGYESSFPILTDPEDAVNSIKIREAIYKFYWRNLNFKGHAMAEHGVWVSKTYNAPHAHNILLQITFDHGWIVGILFVVMILLTLFTVVKGTISHKQGAWYYRLFIVSGIVTVFMTFGMFEMCWIYGQIVFTLLFVAFRLACHRDEPSKL